jgi:signal peptidase I
MEESGAGNSSPENQHNQEADRNGYGTSPGGVDSGWITPPPEEWTWDEKPEAGRESGAPAPEPDPGRRNGDSSGEPALLSEQLPAAAGEPSREVPARKKRSIFRWMLRDIVIPLAVAFGVAMAFQATIAKPYQIPTGSMIPTINENDRILADRIVYHFRSIQRGDVIVFNPPASVDSNTPFVKRVIGLPGDTVAVESGQVLVNGNPYVVPTAKPTDYLMAQETVPPGQLFVLGDNRDDSYDSHRWGFVPIDNVIGRADVIYWPLPHLTWLG